MNVVISPQIVEVTALPTSDALVIQPPSVMVDATPGNADVSTGSPIIRELVGGEPYEGEYTVTPALDTQVLPTNGKLLARDLTINPIPSNYGLITWNGSTLTVS